MTRRSRGIHAAWHFWYAVGFCGESGLLKIGLGGIHPLTQRYKLRGKLWKVSSNKQLNCGNRVSIKSRELC
ncbi:TPA: DUF3265 domain-containing protein [Vibrio vulnificus]|nr:DUF3265 domain-containing protein [Vibrio vulnificus]HAS6336566.1 DUF3265 domain-containing protein [Vibrio vulnificus]HDY7567461.1 DUF3265 domain-containing protein [Vibrio vulnificus]